ncbi:MAG: DUF4912 domain-containing protein [Cyanothece sp. SIO1E1]|nr:DUF4912 domain-containing protein [Cyanothece sp. SIO1E1]
MAKSTTPISALALVLALATASESVAIAAKINPLIAQSSSPPTTFFLVDTVAEGTTVRIGGSGSLTGINTALEQGFEQKYVGTDVTVEYSDTNQALAKLQQGQVDVAAIGRSLTAAEKAQNLVETVVDRHKIAIVVSTENPFAGNLTVGQFAQIFRGEITDWGQIGGTPGPIRLVNRPETSDVRQAFKNYSSFQATPSQAGDTAVQLPEDSTQAMLAALGTDGIGYAIADQVIDQPDVRVITMHQTLPTDPQYPFSQPLTYVYRGPTPNPAVQAFLGYATAPENAAVITAARKATAIATTEGSADPTGTISPTAASSLATPETPVDTATAPEPQPTDAAPTDVAPENSPTTAPAAPIESDAASTRADEAVDAEAAATAEGATAGRSQLPSWLLGLLAIPLLGFLLWWLLGRRRKDSATSAAVTGTTSEPEPPPITQPSRVILVPRSPGQAYAYWEISAAQQAILQQQGGEQMALRLYDVTNIDLSQQEPDQCEQFDCEEGDRDRHISVPANNRDYLAELGYVTSAGDWLRLARSAPVKMPAGVPVISKPKPEAIATTVETGVAAAGAVAAVQSIPKPPPPPPAMQNLTGPAQDLAEPAQNLVEPAQDLVEPAQDLAKPQVIPEPIPAAVTNGAQATVTQPPHTPTAQTTQIRLVARGASAAEVYWEVSAADKARLQQQGGKQLTLRIHDVTDTNMDDHGSWSFQEFACGGLAQEHRIPIPYANRDYLAELGYITREGGWLRLARSLHIHIP